MNNLIEFIEFNPTLRPTEQPSFLLHQVEKWHLGSAIEGRDGADRIANSTLPVMNEKNPNKSRRPLELCKWDANVSAFSFAWRILSRCSGILWHCSRLKGRQLWNILPSSSSSSSYISSCSCPSTRTFRINKKRMKKKKKKKKKKKRRRRKRRKKKKRSRKKRRGEKWSLQHKREAKERHLLESRPAGSF